MPRDDGLAQELLLGVRRPALHDAPDADTVIAVRLRMNWQRPATTTMRARWRALYTLSAATLMIVLDETVINVAMPSIQEDLGSSQSDLAWIVNAYLIAFGGLLLFAGRLGDLAGQRRVFLVGVGTFTAASLLCALAPNVALLIAARFLQGVGGALAQAVILAMITTSFPEPRKRAKAIGIYTLVAVTGGSIGLVLGGAITQTLGWRWTFIVNLPIGAATMALALRLVNSRPGIGLRHGADLPGAVVLTAGLMLGVYTILEAGQRAATLTHTFVLGGASLALLATFAARQAFTDKPLIPPRLLRSPAVVAANATQALLMTGTFAAFFLGALYLQRILHYDTLSVGIAFLPWTIAVAAMSLRVSGHLSGRYGPRATLVASMAAIAGSLMLLAHAPVDAGYVRHLLPPMVLMGLGTGLAYPSLMTLAMSAATAEDAGLASGLLNTSNQIGGAIGLAALAAVANQRTEALLAEGHPPAAALNGGYQLAYLAAAALIAVALAVVARGFRPARARASAGSRHEPARLERDPSAGSAHA